MKAIHIKTNNEVSVIDLAGENKVGSQLNSLVGGYFEAVDLSPDFTMWVNEEGKLIALPYNYLGTQLFHSNIGSYDQVAGDVVITGGVGHEGETLGISEDVANELAKRLIYIARLWNAVTTLRSS